MRSIIIAIFLILIIVVVAYISFPFWSKDRLSFFWEEKDVEEAIEEDINILVLGRIAEGQGGKWHSAPGLVDSIVILNYSAEGNIVNLISLPRDLYVKVGEDEFKLNEVYRRKKIDEFLLNIPEITGISVNKYLVFDAEIVEKVVDELGGIDIVLEEDIIDSVSGFKMPAGEQHLSGEDTIWLTRNRYSKSGDFLREKNQHIVIEATFDKFSSLNAIEKTKFLFAMVPFAKEAESNFSVGEVVPKFNKIEEIGFNSIVLGFDTGLLKSSYVQYNGSSSAYILIPSNNNGLYDEIRDFIKEEISKK